jgi:hypothetical protein
MLRQCDNYSVKDLDYSRMPFPPQFLLFRFTFGSPELSVCYAQLGWRRKAICWGVGAGVVAYGRTDSRGFIRENP